MAKAKAKAIGESDKRAVTGDRRAARGFHRSPASVYPCEMLPALYHALVVEHHRHPRNFGALAECTHAADGANPLCGDRLRVELQVRDGCIAALRFSGEACAIAIASASIMSDLVIGAGAAGVADLRARLDAVVSGACERDDALGAANALSGLRDYASRRACALLPWATVQAAMSGAGEATTEGAPSR